MQLLDSYPLPPGCCAFCRGNATPLIDVGLNTDDLPVEMAVEQSGWVYVCAQCLTHMARMLGMVAGDEATALEKRLGNVKAERDRINDALIAAQVAIENLTRAGYAPADPEVAHAAR